MESPKIRCQSFEIIQHTFCIHQTRAIMLPQCSRMFAYLEQGSDDWFQKRWTSVPNDAWPTMLSRLKDADVTTRYIAALLLYSTTCQSCFQTAPANYSSRTVA